MNVCQRVFCVLVSVIILCVCWLASRHFRPPLPLLTPVTSTSQGPGSPALHACLIPLPPDSSAGILPDHTGYSIVSSTVLAAFVLSFWPVTVLRIFGMQTKTQAQTLLQTQTGT